MNQPKVSIGMPVYNGERFIRQALDSLLSQTHENFELIISDNASTDTTRSICLDYAKQDRRIRFYENKENLGALKNFQIVLDLATSDYFMWAAYDDLWEVSYISTLIESMVNDESIVLSFSVFNSINENGVVTINYPNILDIPSKSLYQRLSNYINQYERLGKANPIYGLMRRNLTQSAFYSVLNLFKDDVWGADMLFVFQLLTLGDLAVAEQTLFHKRLLSTSPSSNRPDDWYSYFTGYKYLILNNTNLSNTQKKCLIAEVCERQKRGNIQKNENITLSQYLNIEEDLNNYTAKESYSHSGEDLIVKKIFDSLGFYCPNYLDIGSYHPEIFSNTAIFHKSKCHGLNIVANPQLAEIFSAKRLGDTNLNLSVGIERKTLNFYTMSIPNLSTFSQDEAQKIIGETKHTIQDILPIQSETINQIIEKYADHEFPKFLSLDVKGQDLMILQSIDYQASCPIVICVRTLMTSETGEEIKDEQIANFLSTQGYFIYADTYINTIFVKKNVWDQQRKINMSVNLPLYADNDNLNDPIYLVSKFDVLLGQLKCIKSQLEVEKERTKSLESSKFWKIRRIWFKLKSLFRKDKSIQEFPCNEQWETNNQIEFSHFLLHSNSYAPIYLEKEIDILSTQIESFLIQLQFEKEKISGIESSKFWKIRKVLFKSKNLLKQNFTDFI